MWAAQYGLPFAYLWLNGSLVLEQFAEVHFAFEVTLRAKDEVTEDAGIDIPIDDTFVILASVLVINDKGNDLMSKALLDHDQPA